MKKFYSLVFVLAVVINLINANQVLSFSKPGDFTLTANPGCINSVPRMNLSWTASTDADSYDVYKNGHLIKSGIAGLNYAVPNLVTGVTYSFYVIASNIDSSTVSNIETVIGSNCTAGALSGVKKVGPNGNYKTITKALNALQAKGYGNSIILEIQSDYSSVAEVFPVAFTALNTSDVFFLTIRPESDGTVLPVVCDSSNKGTINFNGARNVTIDGQFGTDGNKWLKLRHSTPGTNSVVLFQNNSHHITIKNCFIEGATGSNAGNVKFSTSDTDGTGNSFITIDHNKIGSTGFSAALIYSVGTGTSPNHDNNITNNEISNFRGSMDGTQSYAAGIYAYGNGNGDNWNISNNSIYNTTNAGSNGQTAIYFLTGSNGNIISGNFIGGSSANGAGLWENSVNGFEHYGMNINVGSATISGNTFQNIYMSGFSISGFICMDIYAGAVTISNNNFGGTGSNYIQVNGGGTRNIFGPTGAPGFIFGVRSSTASTLTVSNNNFNDLYAFGGNDNRFYGGYIRCISHTGSGKFIIKGNIVSGPQGTATTNSQYAVFISNTALASVVSGCEVSENVIQGPWPRISLDNSGLATTGGLRNIGVFVAGRFSGEISKNKIYNMYNEQLGTGTHGIQMNTNDSGTWTISNNQISFGYSGPGRGVQYGILDQTSAGATINILYNSVYISGNESSSNNSAAFRRLSTTVGSALTLRNNILINNRTGGGLRVAIANEGAGFATGWDSDNNFISSISLDSTGYWNTTFSNFSSWQINSGGDANSITAHARTTGNSSKTKVVPSELFLNANNDLHINLSSIDTVYPAYSFVAGKAVPFTITHDFDGEKRSGKKPTIGIDEFKLDCTQPENVTSDVESNSARISWDGDGSAATYRVQYRVKGTGTWSARSVNAPKNSLILSGLESNTTYEFRIRANCNIDGTINSGYSPIEEFSTLCGCLLPDEISVSDIKTKSATVNWVGNDCAIKYRLQYRKEGTSAWSSKFVTVPFESKTLTLLSLNTTYEYRLRSDCSNDGFANSGWSIINTFSTSGGSRISGETTELSISNFTVTPNPNNGSFEIYFSNPMSDCQVQIFNSIGQRVFNESFIDTENSLAISLDDLADGIYFVEILNNEGLKSQKFIIRK